MHISLWTVSQTWDNIKQALLSVWNWRVEQLQLLASQPQLQPVGSCCIQYTTVYLESHKQESEAEGVDLRVPQHWNIWQTGFSNKNFEADFYFDAFCPTELLLSSSSFSLCIFHYNNWPISKEQYRHLLGHFGNRPPADHLVRSFCTVSPSDHLPNMKCKDCST